MNLQELIELATPLPVIVIEDASGATLWGAAGSRLFFNTSREADGEPYESNVRLAAHALNLLPKLVAALKEAQEIVWHVSEDGCEPHPHYRAQEARKVLPKIEAALVEANNA